MCWGNKMGYVEKCPRCRIIALNLIKEGLPKYALNRYPKGVCRKCKRKIKVELRKMLDKDKV